MHFADNAICGIRISIRVTSVVGYESSICVLYMLIKHVQCGTWCKYPFWLDLVHVTGHIEYHHYCGRAWYPTFVQHSSTCGESRVTISASNQLFEGTSQAFIMKLFKSS